MTVTSDIGCSYISEQWRKTISLGANKLKLVMTLPELLRRLVLHNKSTEAVLIYVFYNLHIDQLSPVKLYFL